MKDTVLNACARFIGNRDAVKEAFPWESSYFYPVCASLFTDRGLRADVETMKECRKLVKSRVGAFSNFRGATEISTVCMLALSEKPEERLEEALEVYRALKEHFFGSEYLPVAAMVLSEAVKPEEYRQICERTRAIYDLMKREHPFLTSSEDSVFAATLALSGLSDEEVVRESETCYALLKERFYSRNAVQSLSHVLTLTEDPMRTAKDKCRDTVCLFDELKERGYKYGTEYELATLGVLAMLPCERGEIIEGLLAADGFLARQKGYGFFGIAKKQRLMHAGMIVSGACTGGSREMNAAAINGTVSMIAAQQAATCAAIAASSAAASAGSH